MIALAGTVPDDGLIDDAELEIPVPAVVAGDLPFPAPTGEIRSFGPPCLRDFAGDPRNRLATPVVVEAPVGLNVIRIRLGTFAAPVANALLTSDPGRAGEAAPPLPST